MATTVVNRKTSTFDVYIGRGSKCGNKFTHRADLVEKNPDLVLCTSRGEAVAKYERWLNHQHALLASLGELKGKRLGCYCAPLACHGDVLARLADRLA